MKLQVLALTSITLFSLGCSQMIWKETNLQQELSPSSSDTAIAVEVHYKEKQSWNPLNGTTDKKDYTTKLNLIRGNASLRTWEIPSWVLADSVFYHPESGLLVLLHGKNDEYGTLAQRLSVYPDKEASFSYPASPENLVIFQASPSPNGKQIALITALSDQNWEFSEFELRLLDPKTKAVVSLPISFWTALPLYGMKWAKDGSALYLRTPDRILVVKDGKLGEANSFPECFHPSTSYGKGAFEASFVESQNPWKLKIGAKIPEPKTINSLDKIQNCL
ncbi:hypothetical protein [Leptospira ognonensis]|nr:hypothetical protein [Leptospira ognonensis]